MADKAPPAKPAAKRRASTRKAAAAKPRARKAERVESRSQLTDRSDWFHRWLVNWGEPELDSPAIGPEKALGIGAYFACIRNISEDVGRLPRKIVESLQPRGRRDVPDHPAYRVLHDEPNPEMSPMTFWETLMAHALGYSGGYAEIVRDGAGYPRELHPLDPRSVTPVWVDTSLYYRVQRLNGESIPLRPDQILHIHGLGYDGITGYLVSRVAKHSLSIAYGSLVFSGEFFRNGTVPSGVLEYPEVLSEEAHQRLLESFERRLAGEGKRHKAILLEEGMKWTPMAIDPQRSQMLESLRFSVEDVCRLFRMPRHKIQGDVSGGYNSIFAYQQEYVTDALMSWITRIEQECNRKLLFPREREKYRCWTNERALLRGDLQEQARFLDMMLKAGVYSINDCREYLGDNPVDRSEADLHWIQGAMVPITIAASGPQRPEAQRPLDPPQPEPGTEPEDAPEAAAPRPQLAALYESTTAFLSATVERVLRVEDEKLTRAKGKSADRYPEVVEALYGRHREYVREAYQDVTMAYAAAWWRAVHAEDLPPRIRTSVTDYTELMAERHVEESLGWARQGEPVRQDGRAQRFASDEIGRLADVLAAKDACHE